MKLLLLLLAVLLAVVFHGSGVQSKAMTCRDEEGNPVDWFIVYKIPLLQQDPSKQLATGYSYAFLTGAPLSGSGKRISSVFAHSRLRQDAWKLSDRLITDSESIFGQTIAQLYDKASKYSSVMYNDQPPPSSGEKTYSLSPTRGIVYSCVACGVRNSDSEF